MSVPTPKSVCPECGKQMDCATGLNTASCPSAGDFSICIGCAAILVFKEDLTLRLPTDAECLVAAQDKKIQNSRKLVFRFQEYRRMSKGITRN